VGIGTGLTLPHYRPGVEVTGIDLSPGMLAVARRRAEQLSIEVDLREMDAQQLDFADGSFDAVVFTLCLCTIPDPGRAVREGVRVARPGAPMLFLEHVRSHLLPVRLLQELINPITVWTQQDHWTRQTEQIVREAGVVEVRSRRWALGVFTLITGQAPTPAR